MTTQPDDVTLAEARVSNPAWRLARAVGIGLVAGVLAKLADTWSSWDLGAISSNSALWVLAVCIWAATARNVWDAVGRAVLFNVAMNAAYYGWSVWVLHYSWVEVANFWLVVSITVVPVVAALAYWACTTPGPLPAALLATIGALPLMDTAVVHAWRRIVDHQTWLPQAPIAAVVEVAAWAIILFVLPKHRTTRLWGLAFAVPGFYLLDWILSAPWWTFRF